MRVGLLGGLEVRDADNRDITVPTGKQQALLALLAVHAGRVVPAEQVVDALWGEDPPPRVRNGLQALASKLRGALGATDLIVMRGSGYVLDLPADAVDIHRFEQLVTDARAAAVSDDPQRAVALLTEAESLWRGDALADFAYEEFAQPTINRLSELRLAAMEERIELELALGLDEATVGLESLVAAYPVRERLRGLLMIALYRAGRQADALRVFQDGRHILADELGLEPGPELRRLEAAILAQDPSLDAPVTEPRATEAKRRGTIPESLTPLVGRDDELRELTRLAMEHRLLSLVGPGGVGKTRLALEVARTESIALTDGGYVVELAPVGDPAAVPAAIAAALDVPDATRLAALIGDRELVIVLDNCEHLIDAAATLAEQLLRDCPRLRLVVTSREALRVSGETVWAVPPLSAVDAAQLFVARAHAAGAPLEFSDDLLPLIADICARLDGLPLAIELAAARIRALPIHQISSRLNDRFRLLTGGLRTALPRQQTLQAVVDWSYDLLFDAEQRVFERLSVFPGGCDLVTAEAVCTDDTIAADDIADIVQALVEKSLVVAQRAGDTVRFTQLQTLCQYGRQRLSERDDAKQVRAAMAAHFAQLAARGKAAFTGPDQGSWLIAITPEHDNLRAALEWAIDNDDAETALLIAGGSSWSHWLTGTASEGKRWLDDAFACGGDVTDETQALGLAGRGLLHSIAGAMAEADADLHDALEIFRSVNDVTGMAFTLSFYAEIARLVGNREEARRRRLETLAVYPADSDDTFVLAVREYSHAILAMIDNDLVTAERHYRESAEGFAASDRPVMLAITLGVLADFDERAGRYPDAVKALERAVALAHEVGMRGFVGSLYSRLAWSLLQEGDVERAATMNLHALEAGRRLRSPHILYAALTGSALLHRRHGRNREAAVAAIEALQILDADGASRFRNRIDPDFEIQSVAAACYAVLGVVAIDEGDCATGAELLEKADRLRQSVGAPVPVFQADDLERARVALAAH